MSSWKKNGADKNDQGHLRSKFPFLHPSSVQVIEGHSKTTQKPRVAPRVAGSGASPLSASVLLVAQLPGTDLSKRFYEWVQVV